MSPSVDRPLSSPSPLVSPSDVAAMQASDEPLVICDVRFSLADHAKGRRDYDEAHIPGAQFVDLHTELSDQTIVGHGRHPLPSTDAFSKTLQRLGVEPTTFVVAYDDAGGAFAARLWWMLRSVGHRRAAVLDGGIDAWRNDGFPVTDRTLAQSAEVAPYPTAAAWTGTVSADEVADSVAARRAVVVDSRASDRYRGDSEPIDARAGHIPGAINIFHGGNVAADGRFLEAPELTERFGDVGDQPIVYCGSGVTACHNILAMTVAGVDGVRLYPGSWSEWSSDPARPVAIGAD